MKRLNIFLIMMLLIGQSLLGPVSAASAAANLPTTGDSAGVEDQASQTTKDTKAPANLSTNAVSTSGNVVHTASSDGTAGNVNQEEPESDGGESDGGDDEESGEEGDDPDPALQAAIEAVEAAEAAAKNGGLTKEIYDKAVNFVLALDDGEDQDALGARIGALDLPVENIAAGNPITENIITDVKMYQNRTYDEETGEVDAPGENIGEGDVRADTGERVAVEFKWELPNNHQYGDGSTFTFKLPAKLGIGGNASGNLIGGVGTYNVTQSGEVTLTFNETIEGKGYTGNFYVWRSFDEDALDNGTKQDIVFPFDGSQNVTIPVHFEGTGNEITKKGEAKPNPMNPSHIEWVVDFNLGEEDIDNAVFKDILPDGLTYDENSLELEVFDLTVNRDGTVSSFTPAPGNYTPSINGDEFTVDFGNIDSAYRVKYKTKVDPVIVEPYNKKLKNKVEITGDNLSDPLEIESNEVQVFFDKPLSKRSTAYDSSTQTITWEVEYNYNNQEIEASHAWIKDTFGTLPGNNKLELDESSVKVVPREGGNELNSPNDYTVDTSSGTGFELKFTSDINSGYKITYETKADKRIYENIKVKNKVEMTGDIKTEGERDVKEVIFTKSANPNFNTKEIEWTLVLNEDGKKMTNVVIEDEYEDKHLTLELQTLIDGLQAAGFNSNDYTIDDTDLTKGFTVTFTPTLEISEKKTIKYTTKFDPTAGMPTEGKYKNSATLSWKDEDNQDPTPITKSAEVTPQDYTTANGRKTGLYNAKTKEITWTIDVNYNLHEIDEAILKDNYTGNQTFVDGSLEVNHLILKEANNQVTVGDSVNNPDFTLNSDGKGFVLNLGQIDSAYRVVYKTSLAGEYPIEGSYENSATLQDGPSDPQDYLFEKGATVTPENGGEYIDKTGKQKSQGSDIAEWAVTINPSQSYIAAGAELTDELQGSQILLKDSFELYETIIPTDNTGNIQKGDKVSNLDYSIVPREDGLGFTLTFNESIDKAYILEYESFINAKDGDPISNEIHFHGQSAGDVNKNDSGQFNAKYFGAGGGAFTDVGKLQIKKIDDDSNDPQPLEGVVFDLYSADDTFLERLTTDSNGEASTTYNYKYNDNSGIKYKLNEISTVPGYVIEDEYKGLKEILFKDPSEPFTIINEKIRQGFEFTKVDETNTTITLEDAEFTLQKADGTVVATELKSDANGKVSWNNLDAGNYELIETKAPVGYEVDPTPIEFEIVANQTEPTKEGTRGGNSFTDGNITNTKGTGAEIVITKVDKDDTTIFLEGAKFELYDNDNNQVGNTETTDANGKVTFTGVDYGKYTIKEVESPEGYVEASLVDNQEILVDKALVEVTFENEKTDRSVKLTKTRLGDANTKLSGAEFKLMKKDQFGDYKDVNTGHTTDDNGELVVSDLEEGEYQLVETKAPVGYILNTDPVKFEIEENQTEQKLVMKENRRRSSGGGGGGGNPPPTPETCEVFTLTVKEDGEKLGADAEFTLRSETKEVSGKTNSNGEIKFDKSDLPEGTYNVYDKDNDKVGSVTVKYTKGDCEDEIDMSPKVCEVFTVTVKEEGKTVGSNVELKLKSDTTDIFSKTDANGKITFDKENLPAGTYTAYDKNGNDVGTVTVTYEYNDCQAEIDLNPIAPETCEVFTVTVKEQGEKLGADVEFTLKSGSTEVVGKTDANGDITFDKDELPEGTYTVHDKDGNEVGTITVTYEIGKCAAEIDINPKACETFELTVKETPNAKVELKDENGKTVATGTTNTDGVVVFDKPIVEGTYSVYVDGKYVDRISATETCEAVIDPEKPEEPVEPEPEDPNDPEKPVDPEKPGDGDNGSGSDGDGNDSGIKDDDDENKPGGSGSGSDGSEDPNAPGSGLGSGSDGSDANDGKDKLPQTGEENFILMIALGILFLAAGGFVLYRQRRNA